MFNMFSLYPQSNFLPDPKLFIWDVESDSLRYFNLATGKLDIHDDGDTENYLVDQEQLTPSSALEQYVVMQTDLWLMHNYSF